MRSDTVWQRGRGVCSWDAPSLCLLGLDSLVGAASQLFNIRPRCCFLQSALLYVEHKRLPARIARLTCLPTTALQHVSLSAEQAQCMLQL